MSLAAQDPLPAGKGRETLENTCTECHGLDKILTELRSQARWRAIVTEMRNKGATMTDGERDTLVDYLSRNFGAVEKINVNRATAKEIEALGFTAKEAASIVGRRESHGSFKEWRDVAKAEGVDSARVEARKDRMVFE